MFCNFTDKFVEFFQTFTEKNENGLEVYKYAEQLTRIAHREQVMYHICLKAFEAIYVYFLEI